MKPFLRPTDGGQLAPIGWASHPAGSWEGRLVDVAYDPRRHDVLVVPFNPGEPSRSRFVETGYSRVAIDGEREMWFRDRRAMAVAALETRTGFDSPSISGIPI